MENPQPAIRRPQSGGQPPRRPPAPAGAAPTAGPRPVPGAPQPMAGSAPKGIQGTDWATFVESLKDLADRIASIRQIRWIKKSSASVRLVLLVLAVGLGSALLVALAVDLLVSLIPRTG